MQQCLRHGNTRNQSRGSCRGSRASECSCFNLGSIWLPPCVKLHAEEMRCASHKIFDPRSPLFDCTGEENYPCASAVIRITACFLLFLAALVVYCMHTYALSQTFQLCCDIVDLQEAAEEDRGGPEGACKEERQLRAEREFQEAAAREKAVKVPGALCGGFAATRLLATWISHRPDRCCASAAAHAAAVGQRRVWASAEAVVVTQIS